MTKYTQFKPIRLIILLLFFIIALTISSCGGDGVNGESSVTAGKYKTIPSWAQGYFTSDDPMFDETQSDKTARISDKLGTFFKARSTGSEVQVIFKLKTGFIPEGFLSESAKAAQRANIKSAAAGFLSQIKGKSAKYKTRTFSTFTTVPYMVTKLTQAEIADFASLNNISDVQLDEAVAPSLSESNPLIGSPTVWNMGYTGSGEYVAVLDTGVDKTHPFLTNKVVSEACYSNAGGYGSGVSVCPGGVTASTATGSGVNCSSSVSGCDHGTHVAGIVAGDNGTMFGVAPDAKIIAIQVFTNISGQALSYTSDQILGMERVYALKDTYAIASVNMSLGGGYYTSDCDTDARKAIIDNLRSVGIATVIASGNNGYTDAVSAPACISTAITVGSSTDGSSGTTANTVSSFSNSSSQVELLAPGQYINSSVPGGGYANWQGTSMATPHVAGAWAVLKSYKPTATVDEVLSALQTSGVSITDSKNNVTKPRINLPTAIASFGSGSVKVTISPASAVSDGAQWRVDGGAWQNSGATVSSLTLGTHTVSFKSATDSNTSKIWVTPAAVSATIASDGDTATVNTTYTERDKGNAAGDNDGDGKADVQLRYTTTGRLAIWLMDASSILSAGAAAYSDGTVAEPAYSTWANLANADSDGDGKADVLFRNKTTGRFSVWMMDSRTILSAGAAAYTDGTIPEPAYTSWIFSGYADGDNNQCSDILMRNSSTGRMSLWLMNGRTILSAGAVAYADGTIPEPSYTLWIISGYADADGDGKADILLRNTSTGRIVIWLMDGRTILSASPAITSDGTIQEPVYSTWTILAYADADGDGKADILLRNTGDGKFSLWIMDGRTVVSKGPVALADSTVMTPSYSLLKLSRYADFNGDGKPDILLRNISTGEFYLWAMDGRTILSTAKVAYANGSAAAPSYTTWKD